MSYSANKRQRSNTSREVTNGSPQTPAPALRQIQHPPPAGGGGGGGVVAPGSQAIGANRAVYVHSPGPASPGLGLGNGTYEVQNPNRQAVNYGQYTGGPVNGQVANGFDATAYHTPPNGFAQAYGSPQQANTFAAAHYAQSFTGGHPANIAPGHYGHPQTGGVQDGSYAQVRAVASSESMPSYPPTPPINSQHASDPTLQSNAVLSQQALSQYAETFATQPSPHTSIPYRGSTASYPDVSLNTPYSSIVQDPSPNGSTHQPDDLHDDDSEDAQGEIADDATMVSRSDKDLLLYMSYPGDASQLYTHPEVTDAPSPDMSKPPDTKCACKKARGKKKGCLSCECSKYGRGCSAECGCGAACGNPFADLTTFFGPSTMFSKPCGANPCFATWLANQPNIEELDVDLMVDMMLYDDSSWADIRTASPEFAVWQETWTKARNGKSKKQRDEKERLEFELLRGGLGNCNQNDFHGYWYSFCERKWLPTDSWYHCQECRQCKPSDEWHCEKHEQCTTNKICLGCHDNAAAQYQDMMGNY
ncbi:uncharacterized protein B0I36DRAFT_357581 [Microdochium trichocladiopsis]|uniref:Tesmin/TSO1-like CXC domain-containing protein n=1 Tax=Microdochium trichocladiopsis TaxID=1682393 RepID=A0A9P8YH96_9PEZI|nr:uncharacterized protein B0I36DRAFT_357581 [Microdochium trichocladiopsis]KAH7040250.1 hypothetical protein B0I36DRAFT_357581 [Microdochium trichocladiopsis]